ncbi:MFS transporter [Lentzea sp. DG1S-22]|uniref:MFS transporter n=1 Tax=Lentzea sp. DG1S-22 TaxID=3108822 RepID=UPI002E788387|nr:MFS transporter [Lentzea sp. DG1S-22]WVH82866.1 MFS transporter [Lentzea sp. DG1S-22]
MPAKRSDDAKVRLGSRFHRLFGATLVSAIGTGMHAAALPLLVLQSTSSPMALSLVVMAAEIPWVLLSLHAGVVVDRLDRRRVMVWADLGRFVVLVALAVLVLTAQVDLLWLVLAAFLLGVGQVFFDIAAQSAVPDFVSRDPRSLATANGRIVAADSGGEDFAGPPLGSALFAVWNVLPFAANALSFAASGLLIFSIRANAKPENTSGAPRKRIRSDIVEGVRWLFGNRTLRALAVVSCLGNVAATAQFAMLALLAEDVLELRDLGFGLLLTATAVGATLGGLAAAAAGKRFGPGTVMIVGKAGVGAAILVLGLVANAWVAAVMMMVTGALMTAEKVVVSTLRQQIVPDELLGRVLSSSRLVVMIGGPVGAALGGVLASVFGVQVSYVVAGVFLILVALVFYPALNNRALAASRQGSSAAVSPWTCC